MCIHVVVRTLSSLFRAIQIIRKVKVKQKSTLFLSLKQKLFWLTLSATIPVILMFRLNGFIWESIHWRTDIWYNRAQVLINQIFLRFPVSVVFNGFSWLKGFGYFLFETRHRFTLKLLGLKIMIAGCFPSNFTCWGAVAFGKLGKHSTKKVVLSRRLKIIYSLFLSK